ncbi:MAG: hypothetical protein QW367_02600 [Candidatus Aenigmatarchaeota archaeon]
MRKKLNHLLEYSLPSLIYLTILTNYKKGIYGQEIIRKIYFPKPKSRIHIFNIIKKLQDLNLIEKIANSPYKQMLIPNFFEFTKVLNELRFISSAKLTNEEMNLLATFLSKIDFGLFNNFEYEEHNNETLKITKSNINKINILDYVLFWLKIYTAFIKYKNEMPEKFSFVFPFYIRLNENILNKIENAILSDEYLNSIFKLFKEMLKEENSYKRKKERKVSNKKTYPDVLSAFLDI